MLPYPNATPEQVERMVVRPVEDALGSVKGLQHMWSMCNEDGGRVGLNFSWGQGHEPGPGGGVGEDRPHPRDLPDDVGDIMVSSNWDARDAESPIVEGRLSPTAI